MDGVALVHKTGDKFLGCVKEGQKAEALKLLYMHGKVIAIGSFKWPQGGGTCYRGLCVL